MVTVSDTIGVCSRCLREKPREALRIAMEPHYHSRRRLRLPLDPPRGSGLKCSLCVNECTIPEGGYGYCGVRRVVNGVLGYRQGRSLLVYTYLDPHPTNCVAEPLCPATTSRGYPKYTRTPGVERGYYNLAVFAYGCTLDCLFCQNWEHKTALADESWRLHVKPLDDFVEESLNPYVTCICYFGGDPTPQIPLILEASKRIVEEARERNQVKRICWETNGLQSPAVMREMARLSLETGGIVKIDWKAWTPSIYQALTGVDGWKAVERLKENVKVVANMMSERDEPPLLVVSILLVPGYVDVEEVRGIASYIASVDERIPIVLLAFHPDYMLQDLPPTSRQHALKAIEAVREAGVREVYLGNEWLLGDYY